MVDIRRIVLAVVAALAVVGSAEAQGTFTWTGASTTSPNWSDAANWSSTGGGIPTNGSTVVFNNLSTAHLTDNFNDLTGLNLAVIQVVNPPSAVTIGGNQITLGTAGTTLNMSAATVATTINTPLLLSAAQTWNVPTTATLGLTLGGAISGGGNITAAGGGNNSVFLLTNSGNSYTGSVTLGPGNFTGGVSGAFSPASVLNVGGASGTAQFVVNGTSQTVAGIETTGSGTRRVIGNVATLSTLTINVASGITHSYSGQVGTNGASGGNLNNLAVVKTGGGLQELTQADLRYTGSTTISAGALGYTAASFASSTVSTVASYLVLDGGVFQNTAAMTFNRNLSATVNGQDFQWSANGGGFSAKGGPLTVNITVAGTPGATIDWGTTPGTNLIGTLKFGHETATDITTFVNGLNLNGVTRTIDVADGTTSAIDQASITGTIADGSGAAGIIKTGNGILELAPTGSNTYSGSTTINGGTLSVIKPAALPGYTTPGKVSLAPGTGLQVRTGGTGEWASSDLTTLFTNASLPSNWTLGLDVSTGTLDYTTITPPVAPVGLRKAGAGTLLIPNSQTFTAGVTLAAGVLQIGQNDSLGSGPLTLGGGTLSSANTTAHTIANVTSILSNITLGDATNTGALTFTQPIVTDTSVSRTITVNSPVTFAGGISPGTITKAGNERLTIQGTSTLAGGGIPAFVVNAGELVIDAGTLTTNGNTAFRVSGTSGNPTTVLTIAAGGTLAMNTNTGSLRVGFDGQTGSVTANIAGTYRAIAFTTGGQVQLDDDGVVNTLNLLPGGLIVANQINRNNNSATGPAQAIFNIDGGTIRAAGSTAAFIGAASGTSALTQANILAGGATIDSNGFAVTVPQPLLAGAPGGGLTKVGAGTLTLTGANTYTGPTAVNAGTLIVGAGSPVTGSLASTAVAVSAAATLGGSGTIGGPVTLAGTVSPGNSIGTLTVGNGVTTGPAMTWLPGGGYVFEHKADPTLFPGGPVPGTDNDHVTSTSATGPLDLTALTASNPFAFTLVPTNLPSSNPGTVVTYTVATFPGGITGFSPATDQGKFKFLGAYDPTFGSPTVGLGTNGLGQPILTLAFAPVPEPGMVLVACGTMAGGWGWWRRRSARRRGAASPAA